MLPTYLIPDPCFHRIAKAKLDVLYPLAKAKISSLQEKNKKKKKKGWGTVVFSPTILVLSSY